MNTDLRDYKSTVVSGIKTLPWPMQMEGLFGEGDHFITYYGLSRGPKPWNTEVFFGGRYELTLQVDVEIDYKKHTVKAVGPPKFYLMELDRIRIPKKGGAEGHYSNDWTLDEPRWQALVAAGGDWSKIGIQLKNTPVPGFDEYVKAARSPRVQVPH